MRTDTQGSVKSKREGKKKKISIYIPPFLSSQKMEATARLSAHPPPLAHASIFFCHDVTSAPTDEHHSVNTARQHQDIAM